MKLIRTYFGAFLIVSGRIVIWAGQTLFHLGTAVMPDQGTKEPERVSQSRLGVLVPYTVQTRDGRYVTLYGIRR